MSATSTPYRHRGASGPERVIMHVDMDAFYASVELNRRPELVGKPMYVGGADRGVVLSANYEARAFGISGGMPSVRARRLCPDAVAVPADFDAYADASAGVFEIFRTVTTVVEVASIDEAFCDLTGSIKMLGPPSTIGEHVRAMVADEQRITCSVGIGPNKFVAKLASQQAKPDGLVEVRAGEVVSFLHPLPVEAIWGVGDSTAAKLHRLGLKTIADLAYVPKGTLQRAFGPVQGGLLSDLAWGRDSRRVVGPDTERSIGTQETFAQDTDDPQIVKTELLRVASRTASRLRQAGMLGKTVVLNLRFADFTTLTRSVTARSPTDVTGEIYALAIGLYDKLALQRARVRRVGVRVEGLVEREFAYTQPMLGDPDRGWREAEQAADAAIVRFGPRAVQRAALTRSASWPGR